MTIGEFFPLLAILLSQVVVHISILSPFLFRQSILLFKSKVFYLLVSFHFYCPRLFVVVYKDVILYIASEVMVCGTYVLILIVICTTIN